jgi:AcrR family transcriptional regulator
MDPTSELRERDALLDRIRTYVDQVGVIAMTFEDAATSAGIQAERLGEFFANKDEIIEALIARNRIKIRAKYAEMLGGNVTSASIRRALWKFYAESESDSRLFFEAYGLALQNNTHYREFLLGINDWLSAMKETLQRSGVPSGKAETYATLVLAVYRGAMMDLLATGQRSRVNAAMELWFKAADWLTENG